MGVFKVADLLSPIEFAQKIKAGATAISQFVNGRLSDATRGALGQWTSPNPVPPALLQSLVDELNRIILGDSIWDTNRFAGIVLSAKTKRLASSLRLDRPNITRYNRFLLEDAFRGLLRPTNSDSMIERWSSLKDAILTDSAVRRNKDLKNFYKKVFKIFDQNLTGLLKDVEAKAEKIDGAGDLAAARAAYRQALVAATDKLNQYLQTVALLEAAVIKQANTVSGSFTLLGTTLGKIQTDLAAALAYLN